MVKYCEETGEFLFEIKNKVNLKVNEDFFRKEIQVYRDEYLTTGNPVFVWRAINFLPYLGETIPVWIQDYLSEVSANILENSVAGDNFHENISKALGLNAKMISDAYIIDRDSKILLTVQSYVQNGYSKTESIDFVKDIFKVGRQTVERAIKGVTKNMMKGTKVT